jgi:hypothetical protein
LTGGSGTGASANFVVAGGIVTSITIFARGINYEVFDSLSATLPGGSGLAIRVDTLMNFVSLWQHEFGVDSVTNTQINAIESFFETGDLGWVAGGPNENSTMGLNRWLRIERLEPDFVQVGEMQLTVIGRPYAQGQDKVSEVFVFTPTTSKIDMKEQRRELRLRFLSNTASGNYQLGRVLISATIGDVRGYE